MIWYHTEQGRQKEFCVGVTPHTSLIPALCEMKATLHICAQKLKGFRPGKRLRSMQRTTLQQRSCTTVVRLSRALPCTDIRLLKLFKWYFDLQVYHSFNLTISKPGIAFCAMPPNSFFRRRKGKRSTLNFFLTFFCIKNILFPLRILSAIYIFFEYCTAMCN